jgi:hypothetical protein
MGTREDTEGSVVLAVGVVVIERELKMEFDSRIKARKQCSDVNRIEERPDE